MKKYITFAFLASLTACTQEIPEPPKNSANIENVSKPPAQPNAVPEVNDANCKFEYMKSITDKVIQQTLADNCARRSTLKTTKHKNWVF
ncbi:MAG: entry exclusion lipoprotein TrbK [Methylococcaceae bacterium]|nr:entry exclusion lipoprotein TrbK [Methylococcaceae bacterium]